MFGNSVSGKGVWGISDSSTAARFRTNTGTEAALVWNQSSTGTKRHGLKAQTDSAGADSTGVLGEATQGSGATYGVEGVTQSDRGNAAGVRARAPNGNADGISATGSTGVIATGRLSGVFAESTSTDPGFAAVTAVANNGANAVAANGRLTVSYKDSDPLVANQENYPAYLENTADASGTIVLGLDCGYTGTPGAGNNFIQFLSPDGSGGLSNHGNVEGNGSGGVVYETSGADYAEYMPRLDADEDIEAADVVGIVGDGITRNTMDAQRALVVTGEPAVTGNSPGSSEGERWNHETVAFTGQVPVKVRGSVNAGALIVPSGEHDGTGVAVTPEEWTPGTPVVGQAWEGDEDDEVSEVTVAVGIDDPAVVGDALVTQRDRIESLETEMAEKAERITDLKSENEQLRQRLRTLEDQVAGLANDVGGSPAPADD